MAMWAQYSALLLFVAANLIVLGCGALKEKVFLRNWIVAQGAIVVLCLPLLVLSFAQLLHGALQYTELVPAPRVKDVIAVFRQLFSGGAFINQSAPWVYVIEFGLLGLGLWGWRQTCQRIVFAVGFILVPIPGGRAMSRLAFHLPQPPLSLAINSVVSNGRGRAPATTGTLAVRGCSCACFDRQPRRPGEWILANTGARAVGLGGSLRSRASTLGRRDPPKRSIFALCL